MAGEIDYTDWLDGEPILQTTDTDGSFTTWIDGEPVITYADSAIGLVVAAGDHLHDADGLGYINGHRYWRISIIHTDGGSDTTIVEVQMRTSEGGSDHTGSGTASASNVMWGAAANAFDDNTGTFWGASGEGGWLKYDFGDSDFPDIKQVLITNRDHATYKNQAPRNFSIEYSDNDSDWTVAARFRLGAENTAWTQNETKTFDIDDDTFAADVDVGDYRYYRLMVFRTDDSWVNGSGAVEIELRDVSGGTDQTGSGTATADTEYNATYAASKAFDDSTTSMWVSSTGDCPHWIKYDFGSGNAETIREFTWRSRNDSYYDEAPKEFILEGSNDDSTWYTLYGVYDDSAWSQDETRTYTIDEALALAVAAGDHLHDTENLTITTGAAENVNLVVADAYHLHDIDAVALTQDHDLVVAECYHLHDADNLIVVTTGVLIVAACDHLHDGEAIALTQEHTLAVAACDHLHDGDNISLSTTVDLVVAACDNLHAADSIILTALHLMTVAECYHVHAPPNLTLSTDVALTISESSHLLADTFEHLRSPDTTLVILELGDPGITSSGMSAGSVRMPFDMSAAFPQHNRIRFKLAAETTDPINIDAASFGHTDSGDTTKETPNLLAFDGATEVTIPTGDTVWSDWMGFDITDGAEILFTFFCDATFSPADWADGRTRWFVYNGVDQTEVQNFSGYFFTSSNTWVVQGIEVAEDLALLVAPGTHTHAADGIELGQQFLTMDDSYHLHEADGDLVTTLSHYNLVVQESYHAHRGERSDLTGTHTLVVNAADSLHVADNLTLSLTLAVAAIDHLHDGENVGMVQLHDLYVNATLHDHECENVTGTDTTPLVVAESYHSHVADSIWLGVLLEVDAIDHLHTADNLTINTAALLVVPDAYHVLVSDVAGIHPLIYPQDAYHNSSSDNIALTGIHSLAVAEIVHQVASDSFWVAQIGNLSAIQEAHHLHDAENVAVTQEHQLIVAESDHLHFGDAIASTQDHTLNMDVDAWGATGHAYHVMTSDKVYFAALPITNYSEILSLTTERTVKSASQNRQIERWAA